jgi:hypothetical protein
MVCNGTTEPFTATKYYVRRGRFFREQIVIQLLCLGGCHIYVQ